MVGRPSFPPDVDLRDDLAGAASPTPGLSALDQEREASLADEGGASGMTMESSEQARRYDGVVAREDEDLSGETTWEAWSPWLQDKRVIAAAAGTVVAFAGVAAWLRGRH